MPMCEPERAGLEQPSGEAKQDKVAASFVRELKGRCECHRIALIDADYFY